LVNDQEACWRGWTIERLHAGLGRRYRDPLFDTLISCPRCRGLGITTNKSSCVSCSGTGRSMVEQQPLPSDGRRS
jgi:RecJ-like exonuclease